MKRLQGNGFTLIELVFILSIMGILVAIGLPAYNDYLERARLAEVMLGFDGMATAARVEAGQNERDLCRWPGQVSAQLDAPTRHIKAVVDRDMASLDPVYWSTSSSGLNTIDPARNSALVVQYAGIGEQGVRRSELLAEMFQDNGLFNQWHQQTASYSAFSVFLDHCKSSPATTTVVSAVTTGSSGGNKLGKNPANIKPGPTSTSIPPVAVNPPLSPPQPVMQVPTPIPNQAPQQSPYPIPPQIPLQVPVPASSSANQGSAPSTAQSPAASSSSSPSGSSVLSQAQQTAQCLTNCRRIWPHGNSIMYRHCVASCR
jgi:type II secretory pathway pseudopilin PulG